MSMFIIRASVRVLARMSDMCWQCVKPKWCCDCKGKFR